MAIDPATRTAYNNLKTEVNGFGRIVLDISTKVKSTSDSRFKKKREEIREKVYRLRREIDRVKGLVKGEMEKIAKVQPDVRNFLSMILQKNAEIGRLEQEELQLIRQGQQTPLDKPEKVIDTLMHLRHAVTEEEVKKDELIEKYKKGERANSDIKDLSDWSSKLDKINDALTKLVTNLGY